MFFLRSLTLFLVPLFLLAESISKPENQSMSCSSCFEQIYVHNEDMIETDIGLLVPIHDGVFVKAEKIQPEGEGSFVTYIDPFKHCPYCYRKVIGRCRRPDCPGPSTEEE